MKPTRIAFFILSFTAISTAAFALEGEGELYLWHFDAETIEKGYTISSPDDQFHVGVLPGVLKGETDVTIKIFSHEKQNSFNSSAVDSSIVCPANLSPLRSTF